MMKYFKSFFVVLIIFILFGPFFCEAESANPVRDRLPEAAVKHLRGAVSNGVSDIFFRANRQYDDKNFQEAIKLYEQLISQGVVSGNIYYNLGNAYFKLGKRGKALINYERAKKLIPDNESLFANMSFIKSSLDVKQPKETYPVYQKIWRSLRDSVSTRAWFFISVILFSAVCLILGIGFLKYQFQERSNMISGILAFLFVIVFIFFVNSYSVNKHFKMGIIITPEAQVRYSPSYSGVVAFNLVEGMKAEIVREQGQWIHLRLNKEKSGWIESEEIEAIR